MAKVVVLSPPPCLFNLTFLLIIMSSFWGSAALETLNQGDVLNSSQYLVSANRSFTLGFFKFDPDNNNNSYLGIRYKDISYHAVWIANRDRPILDAASGFLTVDHLGKLIIKYSGGDLVVIYSGETESVANTSVTLTLLDTGNLVLREVMSNGSIGRVLWESFDHPTDTLLPGMKLGVNYKTGRNWSLTSWLAPSEPASGAFTLEWEPKAGRLVIKRRGVAYWSSGLRLSSDHIFTFEYINNITATGPLYIIKNVTDADGEYFTYSLDVNYESFYDLNDTGKWAWQLDNKGSLWDSGRLIMNTDFCYGYGAEEGCETWKQPTCRSHNQKFELRSGEFQGNEIGNGFDQNASIGPGDCRAYCWNTCDCVGYGGPAYTRAGCISWRGELQFVQDLSGAAVQSYVLITEPPNKERKKWIAPVIATASLVFFLGTFYSIWRIFQRRGDAKRMEEKQLLDLTTPDRLLDADELENDGNTGHNIRVFSFACIATATNNFSPESKLGEGGFGPVYKGKLSEGREIAVKRLSRNSGQGLVEFKNEIILIAKLQHMNLVRLLGCCFQGEEKMLIYEYMPNKSLDSFLFDPSKDDQLDWKKRVNIIEGIAQGLLYLHRHSRIKVIHRDLKAGNILLDENMCAKISDFGLARIFKHDGVQANTKRPVGTYGYMSPEYAMEGIFSEKSDVFSFGVLMLEIVSGRKNNSFYNVNGPLNLVGYAWELWQRGVGLDLMDPTLKASCPTHQLLRFIHVGLSCVEDCATDRPTIPEVITMLKNETVPLPMHKKPAFFTRNSVIDEVLQKKGSENFSVNGLTISMMEAR